MKAEIYTSSYCPFCQRAKVILEKHSVDYVEHVMDDRPDELAKKKEEYSHPTVPIVLVDGKYIGGCSELEALARDGGLS